MYIWILLATFMVMLSFFNMSPREDKANIFSEIKASAYINRFRAEHIAFSRTWDCEILYNGNGADYESISSKELTQDDFGYTSLKENLPIGYDMESQTYNIEHDLYCFDDDLRKNTTDHTVQMKNCKDSNHRYLFSYVRIPERWVSKTPIKISYGGSSEPVEIIAPLPAFTNYLAKDLNGMKNTGWMWCDERECHWAGRSSIQTLYDSSSANTESKTKYVNFIFPSDIFSDGAAGNTGNFASTCANDLCLFSFEKFKSTDTGGHCRGLMDAYQKQQGN